MGDPDEGMEEDSEYERDVVDMWEFVILFHGNLGTFECVLGILQWRALKSTAYCHYQFIVFLMGLLHLKMACADAIWRIFIKLKAARVDTNSLLQFVAQHWPHQTGKIGSNPGFHIRTWGHWWNGRWWDILFAFQGMLWATSIWPCSNETYVRV